MTTLLSLVAAALMIPADAGAAGGTVEGHITIAGKLKSLAIGAKVSDIVVYVESDSLAHGTWPPPKTAPLVVQRDKAFVPHVLPVLAGSEVEFYSVDPFLHNVNCRCEKNSSTNFSMMKESRRKVRFDKPEIVRITCNIHAAMWAFVVVRDNPFFAVPDASGAFKIEGLPPGTYTVRTWHEKLAGAEQTIVVPESAPATLNFDLPEKRAVKPTGGTT